LKLFYWFSSYELLTHIALTQLCKLLKFFALMYLSTTYRMRYYQAQQFVCLQMIV